MTTDTKEAAANAVQSALPCLLDLSHTLHANPEISFGEHRAAQATSDVLERGGFVVERGICGLPTAWSARIGSGPFVIGLCAEYDALPDIGHACGHNVIAAASVGAGLALAPLVDDLDATVVVLGTPAEEGGGGKILLLDGGAFEGVHTAMMVHPWPTERLSPRCLAVDHFDVTFSGRAAHASAAPWEGINALDAMTISQVAIGLLRQHLRPGDQIHGVVTGGGEAANVVPALVTGRFMCRASTLSDLAILLPRVKDCFEAGARATGALVAYEHLAPVYSHMECDGDLLAAYRCNAESLGRRFDLDDDDQPLPTISTDMANVSLAIPSIHPMIAIDGQGSSNHQPEFAAACATQSADQAVADGATSLAWTAIDAASIPALRDRLLTH